MTTAELEARTGGLVARLPHRSTLGLAAWAAEEAVGGINWFRRLLGVGVLVWIVASLVGEL